MADGSDKAIGTNTWRQRLDQETATENSIRAAKAGYALGLILVYHPDLTRIGEVASLVEIGAGSKVSRTEPIFHSAFGSDYRPLADHHLSRQPILIQQIGDSIVIDSHAQSRTLLVDGEPVADRVRIDLERASSGVVLELARRVVLYLRMLPLLGAEVEDDFGLVGSSDEMCELRREIQRVAQTRIPVLIRGETGTGKELVARAIHDASERRAGPWTAVNLGALPSELAASELFGSTAGAYTGARKRKGLFRETQGGTLFLDEIGEANAEVQVALLRVLEEGTLRAIGSDREEPVDVRVLAATDSDLESGVATGHLRAPLLQRLSGYQIFLPPLRQRREDIGSLLVHFIRARLQESGQADELSVRCRRDRPWLPAPLLSGLIELPFPGNVRELRNVADQLVVRYWDEEEIDVEHELRRLSGQDDLRVPTPARRREKGARRDPGDVSEEELVEAMRSNRWEVARAASQLGVARSSLYDLIDACPQLRKGTEVERDEIVEAFEACDGKLDAMVDRLEISKAALKARMRTLGVSRTGR